MAGFGDFLAFVSLYGRDAGNTVGEPRVALNPEHTPDARRDANIADSLRVVAGKPIGLTDMHLRSTVTATVMLDSVPKGGWKSPSRDRSLVGSATIGGKG